MEIEEAGTLTTFETLPKETTLYLTAVRYSNNCWMAGPSGIDKGQVITMLNNYTGIDKVRIYAVKVPLEALGA